MSLFHCQHFICEKNFISANVQSKFAIICFLKRNIWPKQNQTSRESRSGIGRPRRRIFMAVSHVIVIVFRSILHSSSKTKSPCWYSFPWWLFIVLYWNIRLRNECQLRVTSLLSADIYIYIYIYSPLSVDTQTVSNLPKKNLPCSYCWYL